MIQAQVYINEIKTSEQFRKPMVTNKVGKYIFGKKLVNIFKIHIQRERERERHTHTHI